MFLKKMYSPKEIFHKNPNKHYVRKIRLYPPFLYFALDTWLHKMSQKGWHIVDCSVITYLFEKGPAQEKEYFTYAAGGSGRNDGGYFNISLRYPFLEKTYGVKKKNSKINANNRKTHRIIEIDTKRIDIKNDAGFCELRKDRNKLHALEAVRDAAIIIFAIIVFVVYSHFHRH